MKKIVRFLVPALVFVGFLFSTGNAWSQATVRYLWISAPEFAESQTVANSRWRRDTNHISVYAQKIGTTIVFPPSFVAPVALPPGAVIKEIKVSGADSVASATIAVTLLSHRWMANGAFSSSIVATLESTDFNGYGYMVKSDLDEKVTDTRFYALRLEFKMTAQTPNQANMSFGAVRITYTMP